MADGIIFDSTLIIDCARGVEAARDYAAPLIVRRTAFLHPVAVAEVLVGSRTRAEWAANQAVLKAWRLIAVRNADWTAAFAMMENVHLAHGTGWPDCLIAATALRLGVAIATLNDKHFRPIRGLKVVRPY